MSGDLSGWTPRPLPGGEVLTGEAVRLEPFDPSSHGEGLFAALDPARHSALWDWIMFDPMVSAAELREQMTRRNEHEGWRTMVIVLTDTGRPAGMVSYMRISPDHGAAELGAVMYGDGLSRRSAGTEAFYLAARHLFDLGYRRFEWKCNAQNAASQRAALRYGFTYEGRFRQDRVWRGQNRDTDWYSMLDTEWPLCRTVLEAWLARGNFDAAGHQKESLTAIRARFSGLR